MPDIENLLNIEDEVTQVLSDLGVNEKLSEMDDFMNQNDLKVNITNENAVVTGLVTYTCTVKDKNNTALANKVVEWYKGTTLLGMDATDSNGISTFSHRVTEADIYDVHAVVRGTHAGDDIRMFVKDKKNLMPINLFTGSDYRKEITNESTDNTFFACNSGLGDLSSSTEWSSNSERSIKSNFSNADRYYECQFTSIDTSKDYNASVDVYTESATVVLYLLAKGDSNVVFNSVAATKNELCTLTLSIQSNQFPDNFTQLAIRILVTTANTPVYTDNWKLISQ